MKSRRVTVATAGLVAALAGAWGVQSIQAQQPGFKRTELQRHDLTTKGREMVQVRGDFDPGGSIGKHTHPGDEISYLLEGTVELEMDGKTRVIKAGDSFFIPEGTAHSAKNIGNVSAKVLATYVVEKGKPLATPVSK